MRKTLLAVLLLAAGSMAQGAVELRDGHPDRYTVVKGDTLWDISGKFLSKPWKWPEIWQVNPQIRNPHLIYPGDVLSLVYIDGQPRLVLNRGASHGTIKLSPKVRSTPMAEAVPTIPLDKINAFLLSNRIVDSEGDFSNAPYMVAGDAERVVSGAGDRAYARGDSLAEEGSYGIFRQGKIYSDPDTKEVLGVDAMDVGSARVTAKEDDIATLNLTRTTQEVRPGDRLFPTEERAVTSLFMPSEPKTPIKGSIIDVPRGVTQIGKYDVVTIDKGSRDGLEEGNVLAIYKLGETVRDRVSGDLVKIPDERSGLVMIFRTYNRLSYGLVLTANRSLEVQDKVRNP